MAFPSVQGAVGSETVVVLALRELSDVNAATLCSKDTDSVRKLVQLFGYATCALIDGCRGVMYSCSALQVDEAAFCKAVARCLQLRDTVYDEVPADPDTEEDEVL